MSLEEIIPNLSQQLLKLDPGPLAELRRMETDGPPTPMYWRLATKCGFAADDAEKWQPVVKILAILTPKGEKKAGYRLHDSKCRLGTALCDGGNPQWSPRGEAPDGVLSERRLARFFALPAAQRTGALERIARRLARTRDPASGINCIEIAALLLTTNAKRNLDDIACSYYARLDYAPQNDETPKTEEGTDR